MKFKVKMIWKFSFIKMILKSGFYQMMKEDICIWTNNEPKGWGILNWEVCCLSKVEHGGFLSLKHNMNEF